MDSKLSCRAITINQLRSTLLNEIGVYVESESILKTTDINGKFSQDFVENIATISAGITKLQILKETWNGEQFWMKAAITIDQRAFEESLKQLIHDRPKLKELDEIKLQLNEATRELESLRNEKVKNEAKVEISEKYNSEINKITSGLLVQNGNAKFEAKDFGGAIMDYTKAIELYPKYGMAYYFRGICKDAIKDLVGAKEDFTKAIALTAIERRGFIYYRRGHCLVELEDYDSAIADFTKTTELEPGWWESYFVRGTLLKAQNKYKEAKSDLSIAIERNPEHPNSYYMRGVCKFMLNDSFGAVADFDKAIELHTSFVDVYEQRGVSRTNTGDHAGAILDFTKAIELNPKNDKAYIQRGNEKCLLEDYIGAIPDFTKAIDLNAHYENINVYELRGVAKKFAQRLQRRSRRSY